MQSNNTQIVQLYQIWPSHNRFYCKGRLMTGPIDDACQNITTWSLIIGIGSPFVFYISPIIWVEIHPVISLGSYVLYLLSLIFLALTQFSDPGIIPRKEIIEKQNVQQKCKTLTNYLPKEQADPNVIDFEQRNKICATCQVNKPPRSHHCAVCDNCVEIFDHHCPWVNNCIGRNNYAYFLSFIFSLVITSLFLAAELLCFLILIISHNEETAQILLLILLIPLGVALLFLLVLIGFHTYLLIRGKTTIEQIKNKETQEYPFTSKCDKTRSLFNLRMLVQISKDEFVKHNPEIQYSNRIIPHSQQTVRLTQQPEIEKVPIIISAQA